MRRDTDTPLQSVQQSRDRLRRNCRRLAQAAAIACPVLAGLLLLDRFGHWVVARPSSSQALGLLIVAVAPAAFLIGLWRLGQALGRFADQGRLVIAISDGLRGVGIALLFGGVFETALAPGLKTALGAGPGYYVGLDAAAIVIAAVGLGLTVLSRAFSRAVAMEDQLEAFL